jgi:TRAP transporter TAXI family solute receptor
MKLPRREILYATSALAFLLACVAILGIYWFFAKPTELKIAVAPRGSVESKLMGAFSEALRESKSGIRLSSIFYDDARQSAEALQNGKVQLAIVRPDVELPSNCLTIAILREEALVIAAPKSRKIPDMEHLSGHKLGLVDASEADKALIERVLERYELSPDVALVPITQEAMPAALAKKQIDAVAFVRPMASSEAGTLMRAFAKSAGEEIVVIPVDEAEALSLRYPAFTQMSIPAGAFGGRPKQPAEAVATIGISYRLMADSKLDRRPVSELTANLFRMRSQISRATATVNLMKAPETDSAMSAILPNHPGAVDYFNREQQTFMDRYGDWLWLGGFAGGGVTSVFAWIGQFFARKKREAVDDVLESLGSLLTRARAANTHDELEQLAIEVDDLVRQCIRFTTRGLTNTHTMSALMLAIDSTRSAVADRRRVIDLQPPTQPVVSPGHFADQSGEAAS